MPSGTERSSRAPVFTVILDTYYRPVYLRQAVGAIRRQTYDKLEIILVNNGATPETIEYLHEVEAADRRVKLVHFAENQYSPEDPCMMIDTCGNAALSVSTGDYIWYQSDDDWIADDFAEKIVALFQGRSDCTTAFGRVICVDGQGRVIEDTPPPPRPRYSPGHELALTYLRDRTSFRAPGTVFTIRRDELVRAGGFIRSLDLSHLFGIVPFGITGFDETAVLYWRRHDGQLNLLLADSGHVGVRETLKLIGDWEIEKRWQVFGRDTAREVVSGILRMLFDSAAIWFSILWLSGKYKAARNIVRDAGGYLRFWRQVPRSLWKGRRILGSRWMQSASHAMRVCDLDRRG